jgi:hypothetical protein
MVEKAEFVLGANFSKLYGSGNQLIFSICGCLWFCVVLCGI